MKIVASNASMNIGHPSGHVPPLPPHLRHEALQIEVDESDIIAMESISKDNDRDTAIAAMEIIRSAPPEVKIQNVSSVEILKTVREILETVRVTKVTVCAIKESLQSIKEKLNKEYEHEHTV